MKRSSD